MGEAVSALPSAGRSSGRRSSLGPLSEREERMLGSHVHHLLHPVVPKSGQTGEERQARGSDSGAWQSDPQMGSGILTEHSTPPSAPCEEGRLRDQASLHIWQAPPRASPVPARPSYYALRSVPGTKDTQEQDKAPSSWDDADMVLMPSRETESDKGAEGGVGIGHGAIPGLVVWGGADEVALAPAQAASNGSNLVSRCLLP